MITDIGKPANFAALTLTSASQAQQALKELRGDDRWDIQEGSYQASDSAKPVLFHVFQSKEDFQAAVPSVQDTGGRHKVKYKFPYRDGQTTNDLGRTPLGFSFDVIFHGTNYLDAFKAILREMNKPVPGELVHPVMGRFQCVMETYQVTHSNQMRKAMSVQFVMTEHNFSIGSLDQVSDTKNFKKALIDCTNAFSLIDEAISSVLDATFLAQTLKDRFNDTMREYASQYGRILSAMNSVFNPGGSSADIPTLNPTDDPGGTDGGDTFPLITTPEAPLTSVPSSVVSPTTSAAVAVETIKQAIDINRAALATIMTELKAVQGGQGALDFYQEILNLQETTIMQQDAFESGVQVSRARIVEYRTPRVMSLREIAFLNGISFDQLKDVDQLNPGLESVNYIAAGTTVRLPLV